MRFWLDMGVDGLRLDAIPYLIERDGTNCENLPETHEVLRRAPRARSTPKFPGRMFLAEANQWPERRARRTSASGDECHMAFHFPLMPRMFMALRKEDRTPDRRDHGADARDSGRLPVGDLPAQPRRAHARDGDATKSATTCTGSTRAISACAINVGIRRRLAPLLESGRRQIELMNAPSGFPDCIGRAIAFSSIWDRAETCFRLSRPVCQTMGPPHWPPSMVRTAKISRPSRNASPSSMFMV